MLRLCGIRGCAVLIKGVEFFLTYFPTQVIMHLLNKYYRFFTNDKMLILS